MPEEFDSNIESCLPDQMNAVEPVYEILHSGLRNADKVEPVYEILHSGLRNADKVEPVYEIL
eukprot:CAMPEP_0116889548 /NCGR_PEP_ID=MMETSP0467-20121206/82_1 /TAXON_ID=283647 /ORGANISM="Mesodinium pulex, Strain SPMC105" /LENGTH=61 /DNA_ID=CAMNT_0004556409 /DNA_START=367 /DNA_END=549 /DNA_ORIENTATION=-